MLRYTGIDPWWAVLGFGVFFLLSFFPTFKLSGCKEAVMRNLGKAAIIKLNKGEKRWVLTINTGSDHGVKLNDSLTISDASGEVVGTFFIESLYPEKAIGTADAELRIDLSCEIHFNRGTSLR